MTSHLRLFGVLLVALFFVAASAFTSAHFMADSGGYAVSILAYAGLAEYVVENPNAANFLAENSFWDFGHLLWRPFGLVLFKLFYPLTSHIVGSDPAQNVLFLLMCLNFVAGLVSALLLYLLLDKLTNRRWIAVFVTVCFIFTNGILNFMHTGSSYVVGVAFLTTGLYLLLKNKGDLSTRDAIAGGLACAAAVTMWLPFVLVVPATLLAPLVLFGPAQPRKKTIVYGGAAFSVATIAAFLIVMAAVGVHSLTDFRAWVVASSHGVRQAGLARMLFGCARSFIHLGNDGVLFKRFLLHDSLNPVSAIDLVRFSLWKLMLFYFGLAALMLSLLLSSARRMLALVLLTTLPLLALAVKFDGGAVERYLPIYPVIFLAFGWMLAQSQLPRVLKIVPVLFFCVAILVNSSVMARVVLDRQKQRSSERVQAVVPRLKPNSWLVTTHLQDDLVNFQASFPFEPINRHNNYHVYPLIWLNSDQADRWQEEFAASMLEAWKKGGDAWLSTRLLSPRPEPEWNWVEGDDPRVKWNDVYKFFAQLQKDDVASGADGFVLLEKSDANVQLLNSICQRRQASIMSVGFCRSR